MIFFQSMFFFFYFYPLILDFIIALSDFHDMDNRFDSLTWLARAFFFFPDLTFPSFLSFNIGLIEN